MSARIDPDGSINRARPAPVASEAGSIPLKIDAAPSVQVMTSLATSQTKAARPSAARIDETSGQPCGPSAICGVLAPDGDLAAGEVADVTFASFWDADR
jgi:hypothetical protein